MRSKYNQVIHYDECRQAVIMARVSSHKQEYGASLEAQVDEITKYCKKHGFTIIEPERFVFTESSTRGGRKKFNEMIDFVKSQKHKTAIIVHTLDRLQRGFDDCTKIKELLNADKAEVHFIKDMLVLNKFSTEDEFSRYDFGILTAKLYLTCMNRNVKRSQRFNREAGKWQCLAPIGYINAKDENKKATLILDPERAPIIKELFLAYATGEHSLKSICELAKEKNFISKEPNYNPRSKNFGKRCPISRNKIHDILTNPFYYGKMYITEDVIDETTKKKVKTYYKLIDHVYEPIVSKDLFDKVQTILKTKKKENFCKEQKYAGIPFIFRGMIKCKCGCAVSSEQHKKGDKMYVYLRCSHQKPGCTQKLLNEDVILKQLKDEILKTIHITPIMHEAIKSSIIQTLEDEKKINTFVRRKLTDELNVINGRLERLKELRLDGELTRIEYERDKAKYLDQQKDLQEKIEKHTDISNDLREKVEKAMDFIANLSDLMDIATPDEKNTILKQLLTDCILDNDVLTYKIKAPFDKLLSCTNYKKWKDIALENLEEFEKVKI